MCDYFISNLPPSMSVTKKFFKNSSAFGCIDRQQYTVWWTHTIQFFIVDSETAVCAMQNKNVIYLKITSLHVFELVLTELDKYNQNLENDFSNV